MVMRGDTTFLPHNLVIILDLRYHASDFEVCDG